MSQNYTPLDFHNLPVGTTYSRPAETFPAKVKLEDSCMPSMTDLRKITALTVERTNTLHATRERLKKLGVHMLLITGSNGAVMGLITLTDLDSGRAEKIAAKTGEDAGDLLVQDIMTLKRKVEVLHLDEIEGTSVGQVLASMRKVERRHALVLDHSDEANPEICGIFSITRMCAQLDLNVRPGDPIEQINSQIDSLLG